MLLPWRPEREAFGWDGDSGVKREVVRMSDG
jgi:hypothetical protein